jgi:hypothetical protein
MHLRYFVIAIAVVTAFCGGMVTDIVSPLRAKGLNTDYSQELILSELRQQADVLRAISDGNQRQASELLITRIQTDLLFFETAIEKNDPPVNAVKLCQTIAEIEPRVTAYMQSEPDKSRYVRVALEERNKWCAAKLPSPK